MRNSSAHRRSALGLSLPIPTLAKGGFGGILLLVFALACGPQSPDVTAPDSEAGIADAGQSQRAPVETRSRVDRAVATTGDVITYTVTLDYDPSYQVELPETGADIAGFRIIDIGSEEPRDENGRRIEERWYKLRADLVGSYVLPPVEVAYRLAPTDDDTAPAGVDDSSEPADVRSEAGESLPTDGGFESVQTSEIFIEVQSVLPEGDEVTDIRGLKPLRQVETPTPWWVWAAAGAGATLLAVLSIWLWQRQRRKVEVPPRPAHEIAFEALERLRTTDFEDEEAMRQFHFEISEVIRAYVENRFTLNATDLTTEEIVAMLDGVRGLGNDDGKRLRRFLTATDQVKFAAHEPSETEIETTYEGALSFVEATRERPEDAATEATAEESTEVREMAA